jgi:plasmid stability protein
VPNLRDETFALRERASAELRSMGPTAQARLRRLLKVERDPEAVERLRSLVEELTTDPETHLKEWRRLLKK